MVSPEYYQRDTEHKISTIFWDMVYVYNTQMTKNLSRAGRVRPKHNQFAA